MSVAFVTKSYAPDLGRCRLLAESISVLSPGARHWIIVDQNDRAAFTSLESDTTGVVTTEELLPRWIRKLGFGRGGKNVWIGRGVRPMRGWLVQQLAKLAAAEAFEEDFLIHADSDVVLVRPFDERALTDAAGAPRLFRVPGAIDASMPLHVKWQRTAERVLGLPKEKPPLTDYIGGLVPWHREIARSLLRRIETVSGDDWFVTLSRQQDLSEYILYGRYAESGLAGAHGGRSSHLSLCHCYWGSEPLTHTAVRKLISDVEPEEIGVMVSAKAGMNVDDYADVFREHWRRAA